MLDLGKNFPRGGYSMSRKGKRIFLLSALLFAVLERGALAQGWSTTLPTTLDQMVGSCCYPSFSAAFGTFAYEYGDLSSPFSRWLEERLADGQCSAIA